MMTLKQAITKARENSKDGSIQYVLRDTPTNYLVSKWNSLGKIVIVFKDGKEVL